MYPWSSQLFFILEIVIPFFCNAILPQIHQVYFFNSLLLTPTSDE